MHILKVLTPDKAGGKAVIKHANKQQALTSHPRRLCNRHTKESDIGLPMCSQIQFKKDFDTFVSSFR